MIKLFIKDFLCLQATFVALAADNLVARLWGSSPSCGVSSILLATMLDGFLPREHTELTEWLVFSAVVEAEKLRRGRTGRRIVYRPDAGYVLSPRNTFLGEVSCDHPCPGCFAFPL